MKKKNAASKKKKPAQYPVTIQASEKPHLMIPWSNLRWTKSRGDSKRTFSADVLLGDKRQGYTLHNISFATDETGFEKLAVMEKERIAQLLISLVTTPVRGHLIGKTKRPRGRNTKKSRSAMHTARSLGPLIYEWAVSNGKSDLFRKVTLTMKEEGYEEQTPEGITAFLLERNWCNAYKKWPPELDLPTLEPQQFYSLIEYKGTGTLSCNKPIDVMVADILEGRDPYILSPTDPNVIPMTWF